MARIVVTAAMLLLALVPIIASVSPEPRSPSGDSRLPVAMAQPVAFGDGATLVTMPRESASIPESGMLVLVGSALIALAAIVRRTT